MGTMEMKLETGKNGKHLCEFFLLGRVKFYCMICFESMVAHHMVTIQTINRNNNITIHAN